MITTAAYVKGAHRQHCLHHCKQLSRSRIEKYIMPRFALLFTFCQRLFSLCKIFFLVLVQYY